MTVKEMIEQLRRMNPDQIGVVAIEETKESGNCTTQYRDIASIAQTRKFVVFEISD